MMSRALESLRYHLQRRLVKPPAHAFGWAARLQAFQTSATEREWQQLMFYMEMMSRIREVPGDIAEFGVATGVSFMSFARCTNVMERGWNRKERRSLHGFDSFEGLPELGEKDRSPQIKDRQMKRGGFHVPQGYAALFEFVEKDSQCFLHQGWFNDTLPKFLKENPQVSFALVHVDCDLYESTSDVLTRVWDCVSPGGIVVFDELFHKDYPGETLAFRDFFRERLDFSLHRSSVKPDKKFIIKRPANSDQHTEPKSKSRVESLAG